MMSHSRTYDQSAARPSWRWGTTLAAAGVAIMLGITGCSDDSYERSIVADPEEEHDPTKGEYISPEESAEPRPPQREPMEVTEDEVIDKPDPLTPTNAPPEDAERAPLTHPSRAPQVDPAGEPVDAAVPDDPTRSFDVDESPAIDPVGESMTDEEQQAEEE